MCFPPIATVVSHDRAIRSHSTALPGAYLFRPRRSTQFWSGRTWAYLEAAAGEHHEVSGALGHSSVTMTSRYAPLSKGATVAKLGGILTNMGASNG